MSGKDWYVGGRMGDRKAAGLSVFVISRVHRSLPVREALGSRGLLHTHTGAQAQCLEALLTGVSNNGSTLPERSPFRERRGAEA